MLSHDLLEAEEARAVLNLPQAKFELLVSSGQLPIFRSSGRTCFRRGDIAAIASKRQAAQAKTTKPSEKPRPPRPGESTTAARKQHDKYAVTRQTLPGVKPQVGNPAAQAKVPTAPKLEPRIERIDESTGQQEDDDQPNLSSPSKRKKTVWLLCGGTVVAILVVPFILVGARHEPSIPVHAQNLVPFANCKAAPGLVEPLSGERRLSFEIAGKLRVVYVEEGQAVKAGDRIAELENADLAAKLKSSQADLSAAEARLGILRGNLESDLKKAESEVARLKAEILQLEPRQEDIDQAKAETAAAEADAKRLAEDEQKYSDPNGRGTSWSIQLYDQSRHLAEAAAAKLAAAKAHLRELQAGSRPEDKDRVRALLAGAEAEVARQKTTATFQVQSAQAQVEQARAQVDLAKAEFQKTRIAAPIDGTIVRKYMHPGEVIDALHPEPVVTMADLSQLRVRARVDEADFPNIQPGQRVKITAEAMEDGQYLSGTVEKISSVTGEKGFSTGEAKERMDVKVVETIVKFDAPPPIKLVKLGLRVTALFEVGK